MICDWCDGTGECIDCEATGRGRGGSECEWCFGSGECPDCKGTGEVAEDE